MKTCPSIEDFNKLTSEYALAFQRREQAKSAMAEAQAKYAAASASFTEADDSVERIGRLIEAHVRHVSAALRG